jgi:putative photosynthetic complex assembly protein
VTEVAAGSNNFIRGVLRGMFRGRKLESLGHDGVFTLARQANGRLTLEDPETKRRVELDSFGPTNAGAFEGLLAAATRAP